MKIRFFIFFIFYTLCVLNSFAQTDNRLLYQSEVFKLFGNRVEQDSFKAIAKSASSIETNYIFPFDSVNSNKKMRFRQILDTSGRYPHFQCEFKIIDFSYQLAIEEANKNINLFSLNNPSEPNQSIQTRDLSYSALLSLALIAPAEVQKTLLERLKNKTIVQESGIDGVQLANDRMLWLLAAWEVYKANGNMEWLKTIFEIGQKTMLETQSLDADNETGLFYGQASFLDASQQIYPQWMSAKQIYHSFSLTNNLIIYQSYSILAQIAALLSIKNTYSEAADHLKLAVNKFFWLEDKGYYSQYLYGDHTYIASPRMDALGNSFCILWGLADRTQKGRMMANVPILDFGIPSVFPHQSNEPVYHNQSIWPMIQAFWTMAGAKAHVSAVVEHGLATTWRQSAFFLTNKNAIDASTGDFSAVSSSLDAYLPSVSANLALVYRVLFGLQCESTELSFSPFVPRNYENKMKLIGFKYRDAILDIEIDGFGDGLASLEMDGTIVTSKNISATTKGYHKLVLKMNRKIEFGSYNLEKNTLSIPSLDLQESNNQLTWPLIKEARYFLVYLNGVLHKQFTTNSFYFKQDQLKGEYQVLAVDRKQNESYLSKPVLIRPSSDVIVSDLKQKLKLESKTKLNAIKTYTYTVKVPKKGFYYLECSFIKANIKAKSTRNYVQIGLNGKQKSILVFLTNKVGEIQNDAKSTFTKLFFNKGKNTIEFSYDPTLIGNTSLVLDELFLSPCFEKMNLK